MQIAIMDYGSGQMYIRDIPEHMRGYDGDEINNYFCEYLNISIDDSYYMISTTSIFIDKE